MSLDKKADKLARRLADPAKHSVYTERSWDGDYEFTVPAGTTLYVRESGHVYVTGDGVVHADELATVHAEGHLRVVATRHTRVFADDNVQVIALQNSFVDLSGSAVVHATDDAMVLAQGYGSTTVYAEDRVTVHAGDRTTVYAKGDAHVFSHGALVVAAPSVTVRGNVTAEATPDRVTPWAEDMEEATYVHSGSTVEAWAAEYGVPIVDGILHVFKGVGYDGKSASYNETTLAHTVYGPGLMPEAEDWTTTVRCGGGLHFSPSVLATLEYRPNAVRWFKCAVRADEVVVLGDKIKAKRVVEPMVEVDLLGQPLGELSSAPSTF